MMAMDRATFTPARRAAVLLPPVRRMKRPSTVFSWKAQSRARQTRKMTKETENGPRFPLPMVSNMVLLADMSQKCIVEPWL